eukprot:570613-Alexandrium_andersonii.AAC.1
MMPVRSVLGVVVHRKLSGICGGNARGTKKPEGKRGEMIPPDHRALPDVLAKCGLPLKLVWSRG